MKLSQTIKIQPPSYSNQDGNVINPKEIILDNLDLVFVDNQKLKTISVQILPLHVNVVIWSGEEYDLIGDWTKSQVETKLKEIFGDDPAKYLRSLYPKTLEENPNHPGTILSKMIKSVGIKITDNCSCRRHALEMNEKGNDWCEENIDIIVGWLKDEAKRRGLPFIDAAGKMLVNSAISQSRKLLSVAPE